MKELIKKKIKDNHGNLGLFADAHNIRRSSLYDFLNGRKDLTLETFMKIATPLGIEIVEKIPNELQKVDNVGDLKKGDIYSGGEILALFISKESEYKFVVIEKNNELILMPC